MENEKISTGTPTPQEATLKLLAVANKHPEILLASD